MAITWWFIVNILIFKPVVSWDVIQILDYWIFGSSTQRKILLDIDAQKKFISEQESIKRNVQILQRDIDKIHWNIEKWKDYHGNCNIIMYFVVHWILSTLNHREAKKNELLTEREWHDENKKIMKLLTHLLTNVFSITEVKLYIPTF